MNDMIRDIEFLQNVIIAFTECASDEKRMMIDAIEKRIAKMESEIDDFEKGALA